MKKLLLFSLGLFLMSFVFGQNEAKEKQEAISLVKSNLSTLGFSEKDLENIEVSSSYISPTSRARMVYLNQTHMGISIHNQMLVLAFKNDKIFSRSGAFISSVYQVANPQSGTPNIKAEEALRSVLNSLSLKTKIIQPTTEIKAAGVGNVYYHFGDLSVSDVDIKAHLVWVPVSSKKISLAWEIEIAPTGTSDHWLIRVDAVENKIIDKNNYTVFEHLNTEKNHNETESAVNQILNLEGNAPSIVSSATYEVIPFPAESPLHANGTAALVTAPWNLAGGNATSLGWHFDGTTYHDSTRGNNVWAQEDRDNNNTTFGKAAVSSTAQPDLTFDYIVDYTQAPTTTDFQRFATTNLFYWNNLIHDITYLYGFNEASGNFQNSNQGRGGLGNDYVIADAQDGGGTNNANFSTPVDGSRPRMQMYLSTYTTPNRDGDLDNGVVAHEYGHGLSNRLTGGPANSSCLSNAEQGGEGWSDYLALMLTTNWATATVNDGGLSHPIGTYLFGQAPTGAGIRTYPYSTNMSINPNTYAMMATSSGAVHRIGEIWCSALWDMTWELIALDGINTDIFNPNGTGGNSVALKLVIEGMRLQPCSPGYIDARNAILKADTLLYGGRYGCAIWKAFARRGMGKFASQGSSSSTTDQTADFTDNGGITFRTTQSVTQQNEGQEVTYTHRVGSGTCSGINNYIIRDTLPSNVTYVSGGNYDAATRVVSFPVNLGVGQSQNYSFTVSINPGSYFTPVQLIDETVPTASISGFWTTSSTTTTNWTTSTAQSTSAPNSLFTANLVSVSDQKIETTNSIQLPANPPLLSFQGFINSEASWDGGVVEISNNNGASWTDLGSAMISGRYTGNLSSSGNPLTGRAAFHGNSGGFVKTIINLNAYAGQSVKIRFRFGSDASVAGTGWYIDDVQMKSEARVNINGLLFNQNNVRVATSDTFTIILPSNTGCIPATIVSQPAPMNVRKGANTSVSVTATGTDLVYQWQFSTDGGINYNDLPGETASTLQLTGVTENLNGILFRCEINGACTDKLQTTSALLTVNALPNPPEIFGSSRCGSGTVELTATAVTDQTVNWYANSIGGSSLGTGNTFTTPSISASTTFYASSTNTVTGCVSTSRGSALADVLSAPAAPTGTGASACGSGSLLLSASSASNTINWYSAATGGTLLSQGSNTYTTPLITATTIYYAEANNGTCVSTTRTAITATINALPAVITTSANGTKCGPDTVSIFATATTGNTVDWYADSLGTNLLQSGTVTGSNKFITPILNSTTNYWVYHRNLTTGCRSAASRKVVATMNPKPSAPSANSAARCGTGTVTLTATAPSGGSVAWYNVSSGGTSLSTATSYTTPSLSATTNYFVQSRITATGCVSATRTSVAATINAVPAAPIAGPNARCGAGSITVSATPGANQTIDWYSASTGGTLLQSSSLTITRTISTTTSYYATAKNPTTGCVSSSRTRVIATVSTKAPNTPTSLTGLTAICPIVGTPTGTTYTSTSVSGALSYVWTVPSGAVIDSGGTGLKIKVRFLRAGANDTIQVQASNGCLSAKRSLRLNTTGCVTVPLAKNNGVTVNGDSDGIIVYPNPSNGAFQVSFDNGSSEWSSIRLVNTQGVVLKNWSKGRGNTIKFGDDLKSGVYHLEINSNGKRTTKTIVKL